MKLELDVWHYLLNVYSKLQIDIWKHVKKSPENCNKIQNTQNNCPNSENAIFVTNGTYVEMYTAGHWCTKLDEFV